jgi:hypothetical protein
LDIELITKAAPGGSQSPPLLFVHGSGHAAWCWDEHFLEYFAASGFDAHALSLRGHGGSAGRERLRWTGVADYVDDVRSVASGFGRMPVLLGHSLGGLVVQKYLERFEAAGAVLVASSPARGMFRRGLSLACAHPLLFLGVYRALDPAVLFRTPSGARRFLFSPGLDDERVAAYAARMGPESFRAMQEMTYLLPNVSGIRKRNCPMLVLGASEDALVPPHEVEGTARAYGAPFGVFSSMGHDMMLEPGWEKVAERIRNWLRLGMEEPP